MFHVVEKSRRAATHTRNRVGGLQRFNFIQLIHYCMYAHTHTDTVCVYQTHTGHTHTEHSAVPGFLNNRLTPVLHNVQTGKTKKKNWALHAVNALQTRRSSTPARCGAAVSICIEDYVGTQKALPHTTTTHFHRGAVHLFLSLSLHNTNGKKKPWGVGLALPPRLSPFSCEVTLPYWKTREVERWGEKLLLLFCWWFHFYSRLLSSVVASTQLPPSCQI